MGRNERAWTLVAAIVTEPREQLPALVENTDTRSEIGPIPIAELLSRRQFGNIEAFPRFGAAQAQATGPVEVVPLGFVSTISVEHLDAVVLAVGDVDIAVGVATDVMHDVELSGSGARLTPGGEELAI